ncbi:hypothetical protein [Pseudomonas tohonis]|uniref:hypothetical protein n=1 Tax=Pseudomonas tohonis TaxID=2725477 RepID=UPI001F2FA7EA|nr:hypothetical protein [Pseudomonas tohonis]
MAIWHFRIYLVPTSGLLEVHGFIPLYLDEYKPHSVDSEFDENREFPDYWVGKGVSSLIRARVESRYPLSGSWSEEATMFGRDNGTRVELWTDDVVVSIDARETVVDELRFFAELAKDADCLVVLGQDGRVVEPSLERLRRIFEGSRAYRFTTNPIPTLRGE